MNKEMTSEAEGDEEILTFDIPDEALERAAGAEQMAFTWRIALTAGTGAIAAGHSSERADRHLGDIRRNPAAPRHCKWRKPALHYAQESVMEFAAM
jgi:hypothetical protein